MQDTGKILILIGIAAILVGMVFYSGWGGKVFGWVGRLPGDIRIENNGGGFYFPITTCILFSILLTAIARIYMWLRSD